MTDIQGSTVTGPMLARSAAFALCLVCASCASAPPPAEAPVAPPPVADVPAPAPDEAPIAEMPPEPVDPFCARITELNTAYFARDSADLDAEALRRLGENVEMLSRCPKIYTTSNGYASGFGGEEPNPDSLSQARADAVAAFYVRQGLSADHFRAVGRGRDPTPGDKITDEEIERLNLRGRRADSIPADRL